MNKNEIENALKGGLIVSCQGLENEPMHSSFIMGRFALAAKQGGAVGIRANTAEDITEIKKNVDLPVIGIVKRDYEGSEVYITPTLKEIEELLGCGAEIIALDATDRLRPNGVTLAEFVKEVRKIAPEALLMADTSCYEEMLAADELGFDFIGTTMRGYTQKTKGIKIPDFDLIKKASKTLKAHVIAEGGISTPAELKLALDSGAFCAVVGGAITRPQNITASFVNAIKK